MRNYFIGYELLEKGVTYARGWIIARQNSAPEDFIEKARDKIKENERDKSPVSPNMQVLITTVSYLGDFK